MSFKEFRFGKIPNDWISKQVSDYTEIITDYVANGSFASLKENVTYYETPNYAVLIRLTDFNRGFEGSFVYIDQKAYDFLYKTQLYGGEIIISNVGNVGTVFKVPYLDKKMNLGPNSIMVKTMGYDDFYYYWFSSPNGQESIKSILSGSAQPKFNKTSFKKLELPVPPENEQKSIAHILSTLDEKIQVNNQINKTLENMAQAIFKQWFVDFEFPNEVGEPYQSSGGEMVKSELGMIPKGWEVKKASDIASINIGKTPPRKEKECFTLDTNDFKWISIKDLGNSGAYILDSSEYLTKESIDKYNVKVVPDNTVVLSFKLTIGRVAITCGQMTTNEAIAHFNLSKKNQISPEYLYLYLKSFDYGKLGNTSSIATAVNSKIIKAMPIINPNKEVIKQFNEVVENLFSKIKLAIKESEQLIGIRDLLLPKLMSGEIRVPLDSEGETS